jgi:hypothetical protein
VFSTTLRVGEVVEVGNVAAVRVEKKSGCMVKLAFFTELPIRMLGYGLIPPQYTTGVTGERLPQQPHTVWQAPTA